MYVKIQDSKYNICFLALKFGTLKELYKDQVLY